MALNHVSKLVRDFSNMVFLNIENILLQFLQWHNLGREWQRYTFSVFPHLGQANLPLYLILINRVIMDSSVGNILLNSINVMDSFLINNKTSIINNNPEKSYKRYLPLKLECTFQKIVRPRH